MLGIGKEDNYASYFSNKQSSAMSSLNVSLNLCFSDIWQYLLISIFLLNPKSMHAIRIVCLVIITNSKESEKLRPKYSNNSAAGHVSFFGRILHYFKWEISIISLVIKSYDKFPLYNVYIQVKDMSTGVL